MIIVEDKFIFLHFPKTAGMTMVKMFKKNFKTDMYGHHVPYSLAPTDTFDKPAVTFIRNPVDWYISAISYIKSRGSRGNKPVRRNNNKVNKKTLFKNILGNDDTADNIIKLFLNPTEEQILAAKDFYDPRNIRQVNSYGPQRIFSVGPEYWDNPVGLMSYHTSNLFTKRDEAQQNLTVLKYEELNTALPEFMSKNLNVNVDQYKSMLNDTKKFHVNDNRVTLSPESIALIQQKEVEIYTTYGYEL